MCKNYSFIIAAVHLPQVLLFFSSQLLPSLQEEDNKEWFVYFFFCRVGMLKGKWDIIKGLVLLVFRLFENLGVPRSWCTSSVALIICISHFGSTIEAHREKENNMLNRAWGDEWWWRVCQTWSFYIHLCLQWAGHSPTKRCPKGFWQSNSKGDGEEYAYSHAYIGSINSTLPLWRIGTFHWTCVEQGNTIVLHCFALFCFVSLSTYFSRSRNIEQI